MVSGLDPAVVALLTAYRPKLLTGDDAAVLVPQVRAVAFRCAPPTTGEALALMSNVCRFLAGVLAESPDLNRDLGGLLTEARIVWWSNRCLAAGESPKSIAVQIPRLRRMRRVLDGLPARMRAAKPVRALPDAPLTSGALEQLADAVGQGPARAALAAAVGAGQVGRPAVGGTMTCDAGVYWFVTAAGVRWRVPVGLDGLAASVVGVVVPADGWTAVTRAAARGGIEFNRVIAAQTRRLAIFTMDRPVVWLIEAFRVPHRGLAQIVAHLPVVADADRIRWLRGGAGERDCAETPAVHGAGDPEVPGNEGSRR